MREEPRGCWPGGSSLIIVEERQAVSLLACVSRKAPV
jgi:hypothetical protein